MPRRRRQQGLERVLGTPALFATAYGNVGSSIYYALGLVAGIALGLTPLVFVISGLIFAATAATYAEGTVRFPEAASLNIFLAVVDFATQLLLVLIGFALVFSPHRVFSANLHWGVAPTWSSFFLAIPIAMIAYTGIETVSNLAEEVRDPPRDIPRSISWVAGAVFAIYFTLPLIALSALPVHRVEGGYATLLGEQPKSGGGGG